MGRATIRMVLDGEVTPPRQLVPGVPKDLDTICLKALQKPTHRRYPTAEAMAEDLRRFLDGEPIRARPIGPAERFAKWVRRKPARAATLGTGLLAAAALLALGVWSYLAVNRRAVEAEAARVQAHEALAEGTRRMVRLNVANGTRHLDDGDYLSSALWFAEALRLEPKDGVTYNLRGNVYHAKGDYARAVAEYTAAIRHGHKAAVVYANRGNSYRLKNRLAAIERDRDDAA